MSFLATPQNPNAANRRTISQAPVSSNVLGTPWPTLWGQRDLHGTVIAWTNHSFKNSGATGKGGGQVSSGEKDYRTFALGLCVGTADQLTQIEYDNQIIWQGNVTIASANTDPNNPTVGVGGVVLSMSDGRGTVAFYFGTENQTQDPVLAQFVPNAPFYRGFCYAVFHGDRTGNQGFRIGNADTLAQISLRVQRIPPSPPGFPFTATVAANAANPTSPNIHAVVTADASAFTGTTNVLYDLYVNFDPTLGGGHAEVSVAVVAGIDPIGPNAGEITSGTPFDIGSLGAFLTITWDTSIILPTVGLPMHWSVLLDNSMRASGGANLTSVVYELLTSNVSGVGLDPHIIDLAALTTAASDSAAIGVSYAITERSDARSLFTDLLQNWQAALVISNGLLGVKLLKGSPLGNAQWTLQADDLVALRQRPGAWYELPQHVTVKYRDVNRKFRDTTLSLPGAGDFGDDAKNIEIDLPMITNDGTARLVGTRMRTLQALPQMPDTLTFGRAAFLIQFGDIIAVNDPAHGYEPGDTWIVIAVREHGLGDELIELDIVPDIFGSLPATSAGLGGGGGSGVIDIGPINPIVTQDAFELPWDFATDESRRFTVFAARPAPDAEGFTLFASTEFPTPTDFDQVYGAAMFSPGGKIVATSFRGFTMDRNAYVDFDASSDDVDALTSVSDGDWFGYKMLILLGSGDTATLFAAKELVYLGASTTVGAHGRFRVRGLLGPLSDTLTYLPPGEQLGSDIWFFKLQPPYNVLAQPSWVNGTIVTFKGIPYGSRLSSTLSDALAAVATVNSRADRPFPADNLIANGYGAVMNPTYSQDINLSWVLRNRGFGIGYETNPSEFDTGINSEIDNCDVEVYVGGTLKRTDTVNVRHGIVSTTVASVTDAQTFDVASTTGLQDGDLIGISHGGAVDWFGRIEYISGSTIGLYSALPFTPSTSDSVHRYESIGYIYPSTTNESDNGGSLPASVLFKIWPNLNGLRALADAEITVVKV